ncbi:MAG: hypothetical protein J2P15_14320, partial [Micromonosporaceae bacterium]|nr:hypothetical protein [Micromonosporaceae bacterium]
AQRDRGRAPEPVLLAAASLVDLLLVFGDRSQVQDRLTAVGSAPAGRAAFRARRAEALRLINPDARWPAVRALPGGDAVISAWQRRRQVIHRYLALRGAAPPDQVTPGWFPTGPAAAGSSLAADLAHLHCNRFLGSDEDTERTAHALAWNAVRAALARDRALATVG